MNNEELSKKIEYLFDRYWDEDLPDEEQDALEREADDLVSQYGWDTVYANTVIYLHAKCHTPESVVNFASNYWTYGWYDNPIPDPHRFLAYFYYKIDYDTQKYDPMDILDSLATTILPKAGFSEANLVLNTQYMPENDPRIKNEVDRLKSSESDRAV